MKPNILFVLHLPPPVHGASMMGKYIQESSTIKEAFNTHFIDLTITKKLNETTKNKAGKILPFFKLQTHIFKLLLQHKHDLCYVTLTAKGPGFYKDILVVAVLKLFGRKIVYHFHNKGIAGASRWKINQYLYHFVFKNASCILSSRLLYYDVGRYVKQNAVSYCPYGIPDFFTPPIENTATGSICRLLFLSNMMAQKGVYILLDACRILKIKGLNFECHFVGAWSDVSEESFYAKVRENNVSDVVTAHGKKYDKEKLRFYSNADIFVFPTYYHNECFPVVLLEAMQFSLPIVSSHEGGIPEIVMDNTTGFLVPQNNPTELAEKIAFLIRHPETRKAMGTEARKRFNNAFTLEKFEQTLVTILKNGIQS